MDTCRVEEGLDRRLYFPDARGGDRYLRVTWHRETSTIVLSHWRGDVCVASTPVTLDDATRLIGLIVGALKERSTLQVGPPKPHPATAGNLLARLRRRLRPQLAQIVRLPARPAPQERASRTGGPSSSDDS